MSKLRKMWVDINCPIIIDLMEQMQTQSKTTLARFAYQYAVNTYLPIYLQNNHDDQLLTILPLVENWIEHPKEKVDLKELRNKASTIKDQNTQIQYRSIITALAVMSTPTNVLGFLLYGCMAVAYTNDCASQEEYDQYALRSLEDAYQVLQSMSVENEPHPAKLKFNC